MPKEFKLPDLGEGLSEAVLVDWKIKEGDTVRSDQTLAEVETDKAVAPLPSPFAGKILKLHFKPGDTVPVGAAIVTFEAADGKGEPAKSAPGTVKAMPPPAKSAPTKQPAAATGSKPAPASDGRAKPSVPARTAAVDTSKVPVLAAPATRKLAREMDVNISQIKGTGPGGRITAEDVRAFASSGGRGMPAMEELIESTGVGEPSMAIQRPMLPDFSQFGEVERKKASAIRKRIAQRMVISQQTAASVTHMDEADVTSLEESRAQAKALAEAKGIRLTMLPYLVKAVVAALKQRPIFGASYDDDKQEIVYKKYFNIGIAVDSPQGLLVPVVRNADKKTVAEIAKEIVELAERARDGKLTAEQMRGGTFTITNIGAIGGLAFTPVINWPEVAILGLGRIHETPAIQNGQLVARKKLPLCLTFDHRVIDGADGARFVNDIRQYLENPLLLLLDS